jgi:hypothetical protein
VTRYYFLSEILLLSLWGVLSEERLGLSPVSHIPPFRIRRDTGTHNWTHRQKGDLISFLSLFRNKESKLKTDLGTVQWDGTDFIQLPLAVSCEHGHES